MGWRGGGVTGKGLEESVVIRRYCYKRSHVSHRLIDVFSNFNFREKLFFSNWTKITVSRARTSIEVFDRWGWISPARS